MRRKKTSAGVRRESCGYEGGEDYYGRGYVHLTHDYNYKQFDELLGMNGELIR